jgi:hypothetical protein
MKYFSVFTDFTYNRRDLRGQTWPAVPPYSSLTNATVPFSTATAAGRAANNAVPFLGPNNRIECYDATWSFMLMAHYPFLPDAEVPGGRLNPYIAVGPGIMFSSMNVGHGYGSGSTVNIALVAEAGIRFFCLKNVSIDGACRYRYAQPSYDLDVLGQDHTVSIDALHQISFLFRANYHF